MSNRFGTSISIDCKCEHNFTCKHCLKAAADRNSADYNMNPIWWVQTGNKDQRSQKPLDK